MKRTLLITSAVLTILYLAIVNLKQPTKESGYIIDKSEIYY